MNIGREVPQGWGGIMGRQKFNLTVGYKSCVVHHLYNPRQ